MAVSLLGAQAFPEGKKTSEFQFLVVGLWLLSSNLFHFAAGLKVTQ